MRKNTPTPHDAFAKELLSYKSAAIAFVRQTLSPEITRLLDFKRMTYADKSYTNRELRRWVSDLVLSIPLRGVADKIEVSTLIEHKAHRSRLLPFQLLTYVAAGY